MGSDFLTNQSNYSYPPSNTHNEKLDLIFLYFYYMDILHWIKLSLFVVGTFLNVWYLIAILSSPELRSRFRNKIICNILLFCLVDTLLTFPITAGLYIATVKCKIEVYCQMWSLMDHLTHVQDFINNWLIVSLIAVFIAQIQDFNPASSRNLTSTSLTVGTYLILSSPWLAAVLIVPLVIYTFQVVRPEIYCYLLVVTEESLSILKYTDTVVPIVVAVLLLILAAVLKHLRAGRNRPNDGMQDGLIGASMKIDQTRFYVLAVGMCLICDVLAFLHYLGLLNTSTLWLRDVNEVKIHFYAPVLSDSRVLLTPFVLLFLEDIRERIKTWRPWRRSLQGPELTVHFNKKENPPTSLTYG